ncbi:MAG: M1 family peptidase [Gammaproteobacteria bacterium]|nr:M1 family peptidase [Gammaproteobacteria bacterium]MCP5137097.1 M1 family peptidase [Gammaproteobacteria bacterium]
MSNSLFRLFIALLCIASSLFATRVAVAKGDVTRHSLRVALLPDSRTIQVTDTLVPGKPPANGTIEFALGSSLHPMQIEGVACVEPIALGAPRLGRQIYQARLDNTPITLCFDGQIGHEESNFSADMLRGGLGGNDAVLTQDGAYLGPDSGWYPVLADDERVTFDLDVQLPDGWLAVSQGRGSARDADGHGRWQESEPQVGIHLVAGPWTLSHEGRAEVYLRDADTALAQRYLAATQDYLDLYERLIGPYPYAKFALIENIWESGWGMPSFTLLGSQVLRLPFILHTSYPHEILHNWWGNSVYVDYAQGNWSEGLTTYLADYALAERAGSGLSKRRDALTAYARYQGEGLALANFIGRHDRSSQAVGYGKSFMFFHMLRQRLGDRVFIDGLRRFYTEYRFQRVGYREMRAAFEGVSGQDLGAFFAAWIPRSDAPSLALSDVTVGQTVDGFQISGTLTQTQSGAPYPLHLPVVVTTETGAHEFVIDTDERTTTVNLALPEAPSRLAVDPRNDVFRKLDDTEIPPALGEAMHAEHIVLVLPRKAEPALLHGYQDFARRWAESSSGIETVWDDEFQAASREQAVWYLGRDNRHRCELDNALEAAGLSVPGHEPGDSVALAIPSEQGPQAWLFTDNPQALAGLARKLPHYGRYAWLRFQGDAPTNIGKGDWPVTQSPLQHVFKAGAQLNLTPRPPLLPR